MSDRRVVRIVETGRDRILVIQGDDGICRLEHERYYRNEYEGELIAEGWWCMPSFSSYFDDPDEAEVEARRLLRGGL